MNNFKEPETDEATTFNIEEYFNVLSFHGNCYQFIAMLKKRLLCNIHAIRSFILYNLLIIILLIPIVIDFRSFISRGFLPSLEISIEAYEKPYGFYEEIFITNETKNLLNRCVQPIYKT